MTGLNSIRPIYALCGWGFNIKQKLSYDYSAYSHNSYANTQRSGICG